MDYAKKIKEYREKKLITQQQLAKLLGVGIVNVSRWEKGHFNPTIETKKKLRILFIEAGMEENNNE